MVHSCFNTVLAEHVRRIRIRTYFYASRMCVLVCVGAYEVRCCTTYVDVIVARTRHCVCVCVFVGYYYYYFYYV